MIAFMSAPSCFSSIIKRRQRRRIINLSRKSQQRRLRHRAPVPGEADLARLFVANGFAGAFYEGGNENDGSWNPMLSLDDPQAFGLEMENIRSVLASRGASRAKIAAKSG
jgi:hypothetical protein